jgi:PKD repeat protein
MKTHYKYTNWLSFLKLRSVLTVLMTLAFGAAMAQLSGSYTINSANATSGTNFKSFSDFADSINANGVNGAVTVNVVAGSGPYTEQVTFNAVSGVSATNTVTINGNGEVLQFSATSSSSSHTLLLNGTDRFTIDDLEIQARGSSVGRCVQLRNSADYNTLTNCTFSMPNMSSTSSANAYILVGNGTSSLFTQGDPGGNIVIDNNLFESGTNRGPYAGIAILHESSGTNQHPTQITNNEISDFYYSAIWSRDASKMTITDNEIHRETWNRTGRVYAIYLDNNRKLGSHDVLRNEIHSLTTNRSGRDFYYGIWCWPEYGTGSGDLNIKNNDIHFSHGSYAYGIYVDADYSTLAGKVYIEQNSIDLDLTNNGFYTYGIFFRGFRGEVGADIKRNSVNLSNSTTGSYGAYGIYNYMYDVSGGDCEVSNNIINLDRANTVFGYYGYSIFTEDDIDVLNNTVNIMNNNGSTANGRDYGYYMYYMNGRCENNIVSNTTDGGDIWGFYGGYTTGGSGVSFKNNNIYVHDNPNATTRTSWWAGTDYDNLTDWQAAQGSANSIEVDPQFLDAPNGDLTPTSFAMVNKGATTGSPIDIDGNTRSTTAPDMGAIEFYIDAEFTSINMTGGAECGGYEEPVSITIKNNSAFDISGVPVQYDVNGGTPVTEVIGGSIAPGDDTTYVFMNVPVFNGTATHDITATITGTDDAPSNHTRTHTITTTAAPYGGDLVGDPNTFKGIYQLGGSGGTMNNPDISIADLDITYDVTNPVNVSGTYGTDWELIDASMTSGGTPVASSMLSASGLGTATGTYTFTPDNSLEDSLVFIGFTARDYNSNCDSTFGRWVYIPFSPQVDFTADAVCDGEVVAVVNNTTIQSGLVVWDWHFNDPDATAEDVSDISDPIHNYTTFGTHTIDLVARLFDYPKFEFTLSKTVEVSPVPAVDFKVENACKDEDLTFNNLTSLPAGITGTIDYTWDFGDGTPPVNTQSDAPQTHQYQNAGGYSATLTASFNGCAASVIKNANQFARPVADFTQSGLCNLEEIQFTNASTIEIGGIGYKWDFGDNTGSRIENPTHAFANAGSQTVKLIAESEFGCTDEKSVNFTLEQSPKADFDFSDPCNLNAVEFTNTTNEPSGFNTIYAWDFSGEATSTNPNPSHLFDGTGVKTVTLTASSDNGCSDMVSKEFLVKLQAKADFVANSVCEGENVVFTNKSTVAAGNLDYLWRYGDGSTDNLTSPEHLYTLATPGQSESFVVTLVAIVPGGCSDSISQTVTVNALSDPSFDAVAEGRELVISNQATQDATMTYNWRFGGYGRSSDVTPTFRFDNVDEATVEVCLGLINNDNCLSTNCEEVTINLVSARGLDPLDMINVYPNPSNGVFNVSVKDAKEDVEITILDATGKVVGLVTPSATEGTYEVDMSTAAAGVYFVQVTNGNYSGLKKITLTK